MFEEASRAKLIGVHEDLARVVVRGCELVDGGLLVRANEGLRTLARQTQLVASGASRTMHSRHLTGHAVDLLPLMDLDKDGKVELTEMYNWPLSFKVANAMRLAAIELGIPVVWGGCFDRLMSSYRNPQAASADYVQRHIKAGNPSPFVDGPHFQLDEKAYP